jgi:hypothetical protein
MPYGINYQRIAQAKAWTPTSWGYMSAVKLASWDTVVVATYHIYHELITAILNSSS